MRNGLEIGGISLVTVFSLALVATIVLFIYYAVRWAENDSVGMEDPGTDGINQQNRKTRAEYAYYAGVIVLLFIITGMHSFVIAKELL